MSDTPPPVPPEPTQPNSGYTPPVEPQQTPPSTGYTAPVQPNAGYTAQPMAPNPYAATGAPAVPKTLSLISMIAGIVGVVSFGWFGIASIAALILGYMGKTREPAARGFWLTGIITGWVGVALMILVVGGFILFSIIFASSSSYIN